MSLRTTSLITANSTAAQLLGMQIPGDDDNLLNVSDCSELFMIIKDNNTSLFNAKIEKIKNNDPDEIQKFATVYGGRLLWEAVFNNNIEMVRELIELNVNVNYIHTITPFISDSDNLLHFIKKNDQVPVLGIALKKGNLDIIQLLMGCANIDPNILMSGTNRDASYGYMGDHHKIYQSRTLLHSILNQNHIASFGQVVPLDKINIVIKLFLDHPKIDVNTLDADGVLMLNLALKNRQYTKISDENLYQLIELTASDNILSVDPFTGGIGYTSLYFVHQNMYPEYVHRMPNYFKLHTQSDHPDTIKIMHMTKMLLDKINSENIKVFNQNKITTTLLHEAIKYGGHEQIELLYNKIGPDCLTTSDGHISPLQLALSQWDTHRITPDWYGYEQICRGPIYYKIVMILLAIPDISRCFHMKTFGGTVLNFHRPYYSAEIDAKLIEARDRGFEINE